MHKKHFGINKYMHNIYTSKDGHHLSENQQNRTIKLIIDDIKYLRNLRSNTIDKALKSDI
mgnify:CR=1 FL=1